MKIAFLGDRNSKTIKLGRLLKILFPQFIVIELWDKYPSRLFIRRKDSL